MADIAIVQPTPNRTPTVNTTKNSLVELKNGRINLKQRILAFDKMSETMQEIVQFRDMLEKRIEKRLPPLEDIADEYKPLVAKLVHESDKTIVALAKHIHSQLIPAQDEDDEEAIQASAAALPLEILDRAAKSIADRVDYGLEVFVPGARIPAGWHIWRWEVRQENRHWLPKAAKDKIETRLAERAQAKKDVQTLFQSLSQQERKAVLNIKENFGPKSIVIAKSIEPAIQGENAVDASDSSDVQLGSTSTRDDAQLHSQVTVLGMPSRPKKLADPEKAIKEKEREERKNAKLERERKAKAAQEKSRSLMANFFTKTPAVQSPVSCDSSSLTKEVDPSAAGPSDMKSDYVKAFRPFTVKRDVELAPINSFHHRKKGLDFRETRDMAAGTVVIVIDDDEERDVQMRDVQPANDLGQLTAEERLRSLLAAMTSFRRRRSSLPSGLKSYHPYIVRNILNQLNEAEIAGDDHRVRWLLSVLRDRQAIPSKVLIFTEDSRPGYFGTWTRNSREVGPRTPLARDVVSIDYTYDSGEEWEEESGEADDVVEDAEDEDAGEEQDSDLDSWLVDDDEVEEPGTPLKDCELSPEAPLPLLMHKRKAKDENQKLGKRRKVVIPLVPYTKGPCWEEEIGKCDYEPFKQYRIQLLNDTPFPLDPFKFVAAHASDPSHERRPIAIAGSGLLPDAQFAIPALPDRLTKPTNEVSSSVKRTPAVVVPKTSFPDAHLPVLVAKIQTMQTGNVTGIVETVYQELRVHKVKKNAIEAKLKEIGEKSKEKKIWVVKPEYLSVQTP